MEELSNKCKMIISSVLVVVFAAITVFSVTVIATGAMPSVPNGVKLFLLLGGAAGFLLFFCFTVNFAVLYAKERAKDKRLIAAGLKQNHTPACGYEERDKWLIAAGLKQNPQEDVIRGPIIADDDQKGYEDFEERTKKFFANIVYPQGFIGFLKRYGKSHKAEEGGDTLDTLEIPEKKKTVLLTRYIERGGDYFVIDEVYPQGELSEINEYILTSAEYYSQFSNVLFFADDESGHCHFLLDYGNGGEPRVKYLDDETDVVRTLADNFTEFTEKLKESTYEEFCEKLKENEKNKLKR